MTDFAWLSQEAKNIHQIFENLFYSFMLVLLLIGVLMEYFKFSVGGMPGFMTLMGRCLVASIMLVSFPEVLNLLASVVDSVAEEIGNLNEFKLVLSRMGEEVDKLTWSWTSVKQMTIVAISFVTFFILYISVYISEAIYMYAWTLLYIFSPVLIALYVLPQTAGATKGLYSSIFQVASWKIIWSVLATLLWSAALMDLEKLGVSSDFLTIILFNIMLAASLLLTPLIGSAIIKGGLAQASARLGGVATSAGAFAATKIASAVPYKSKMKSMPGAGLSRARSSYKTWKDNQAINKNPGLTKNPTQLPSYQAEQKREQAKFNKLDQQAVRQSPYKRYMPSQLPSEIEKKKRMKNQAKRGE